MYVTTSTFMHLNMHGFCGNKNALTFLFKFSIFKIELRGKFLDTSNYRDNEKTSDESFPNSRAGGLPRKATNKGDARRMRDKLYDMNPVSSKGGWAKNMEIDERYDEAVNRVNPKPKGIRRPRRSQGQNPPMVMPAKPPPRGMKEKGLDEFDVDVLHGMDPVHRSYAQNLDHSNFVAIVDASHEELCRLDPGLRRTMPYAMYQHYCFQLLNAKLLEIDRVQNNNSGLREEGSVIDMIGVNIGIHEPIAVYLDNIGQATTGNGDTMHVNLPIIAISQLARAAGQGLPPMLPGSFGPATAETHNVYEAYCSPLVSRRLIEETIRVNQNSVPPAAWEPVGSKCRFWAN